MKHRTVIYRDGLVFLGILTIVFLGAMVRQVNLLLLFASILACFVVLDFWAGRRLLTGLSIQRKGPGTPSAGEPFLVPITLSNQKKVPSWSLVVEDTVTPLDGLDAEGILNRQQITPFDSGLKKRHKKGYSFRPICYFHIVPALGEASGSWGGILPRRGRYRLGPMTISSRFPLGFFRSAVPVPGETLFCVGPKIGHLSQKWVSILRERAADAPRRFSRVERYGEELFGLRQWQPDDTRRSIHQRASAKHQKLLVRQFQRQTLQTTAIILDLFESEENDSFEQLENRERAISFAATLFAELYGKGKNPVAFGINGHSRGLLDSPETLLNRRPEKPVSDNQTDSGPDSRSNNRTDNRPDNGSNNESDDGSDNGPDDGLFYCRFTAGISASSVITEHLATAKAGKKDRLRELLAMADMDGEAVSARVIITPRGVDLERRLEEIRAGSGTGAVIMDASTKEFDEIFHL